MYEASGSAMPFYDILASQTGLQESTVRDLFSSGWTLTVSIGQPTKWESPLAQAVDR